VLVDWYLDLSHPLLIRIYVHIRILINHGQEHFNLFTILKKIPLLDVIGNNSSMHDLNGVGEMVKVKRFKTYNISGQVVFSLILSQDITVILRMLRKLSNISKTAFLYLVDLKCLFYHFFLT
jgi:hypothetical protein